MITTMRFRCYAPVLLILVPFLVCCGCASKKVSPMEQGIQNFDARQFDEAKANFESIIVDDAENAEALYYLGRIALNGGDVDLGVERLNKAVQLDTTKSDYHFWLGVAYAQQIQKLSMFEQGQFAPKIKSEFEKAVEADPNNIEARMGLAQYHLNAPPIVGGSLEKADEQIEAIKKLDPKKGHLFLAQIHMAKNEFDEAEQELKDASELDANDPDIDYELGMFYQKRENYPAAFEALENAIQKDADYAGAYYQIGRTAIFSGDHIDRGIECLQQYIKKDIPPGQPSRAHAHWRLGMLYEKAGDVEKAKQEYRTALELDPSIEDAKTALDKLEQ